MFETVFSEQIITIKIKDPNWLSLWTYIVERERAIGSDIMSKHKKPYEGRGLAQS